MGRYDWKVHVELLVPESELPVRLAYFGRRLPANRYLAFCRANPELRIERNAKGEIVIRPYPGLETSYRITRASAELWKRIEKDGRGEGFGASAQFLLPDTSALSPCAAWVSKQAVGRMTAEQRRGFPPLCPPFVLEFLSPRDRLEKTMEKMDQWMKNGVQLAWLIDGDSKTVYVYRPGKSVEKRQGIQKLAGEGPVKGFVLKLGPIWAGLG
jgi:Uma2 family endonuclease